jgi:methyl-accepting chemotaxis protein
MEKEYKFNFRDWLAQIWVRLAGLMLFTILLPLATLFVWDNWVASRSLAPVSAVSRGGSTGLPISMLVAGLCFLLVVWRLRRLSQRITSLGLGAEAFASRGALDIALPDQARDELAWVAFSFNQMTKRLKKIAAVAEQAATGDLTAQIKPRSEEDRLGQALNNMIVNLKSLVGQVTATAGNLGSASLQLSEATDQSGQATAQVVATIQQVSQGSAQQIESVTGATAIVDEVSRAIDGVAKGAQQQAVAISQVSQIVNQLTNAIQQISADTQAQVKGSADSLQTTCDGAKTVQQTILGMQAIKARVGVSAQKVKDMGVHSEQIGAIVETIDDIASQTNLLALNAAIEAARAGEHGKGFAVVADEVRKLAEKSAAATKEVARLIHAIQTTVREAVVAMEQSALEVEAGVTGVGEAQRALDSIQQAAENSNRHSDAIAAAARQMSASSSRLVEAMETVSAIVEENTAAAEEMAAGSSEISFAFENITSVSEENSAAVQEVSAAVVEVNQQVQDVSASARSLSSLAQELQRVIVQFKLDDASVKTDLAVALYSL